MPIKLTAQELQGLQRLVRAAPKKWDWVRPVIVLRAAKGEPNYAIAKDLRISRNTVKQWRFRFARERMAGLETRPIPGRPKKVKAKETPHVAAS